MTPKPIESEVVADMHAAMLSRPFGDGSAMKTQERMILIDAWMGLDAGDSDDFDRETQNTVANKELMGALARRKARNSGRYLSAEEVGRELGLVR